MLKIGCISDDLGNASAAASNLVAAGMRVIQTRGVPRASLDVPVDATVVALSTRYAAPGDAVAQVLDALVWLKTQGAAQIYFCFSPTFDSVFQGEQRGNIGPVIAALMAALNVDFTVVAPASPDQGITLFKGHLFVGELLLHECGMEKHLQTPMTDANLMRVLQAQTTHPVALLHHEVVGESSIAIQEKMAEMRLKHVALALVDTTCSEDLLRVGDAVKSLPLVTGSPDLGLGLPHNFGFYPSSKARRLRKPEGARAVICGIPSEASRLQVQSFHALGHPAMALDAMKVAKFGAEKVAQAALAWAAPLLKAGPVLFYSGITAATHVSLETLMGVTNGRAQMDTCLAEIACGLVERNNVRQLIVSGNDLGVRCLENLNIQQMRIGVDIEHGVHWCYSQLDNQPDVGLHFVLLPNTLQSANIFTTAFDWIR